MPITSSSYDSVSKLTFQKKNKSYYVHVRDQPPRRDVLLHGGADVLQCNVI